MRYYKCIDLDRNENIYNYINTYHNIDHELREVYLEADTGLQKLVKRHYLKRKALVILFNISFYIVPFMVFKLTQG